MLLVVGCILIDTFFEVCEKLGPTQCLHLVFFTRVGDEVKMLGLVGVKMNE